MCPQAAQEDESSLLRQGVMKPQQCGGRELSVSLGTGRVKLGGTNVSDPSAQPGLWLNPKAGFFSQMSLYFDVSVMLKKSREACSFK